jgi:Protein of unknown function (DUF998)
MGHALKTAAACGMGGPILFASVVAALTVRERGFMLTLGWDPLVAPTRDWPSGLALGPEGFVMTATFLVCGLILAFFVFGLLREFRSDKGGRTASIFLFLAGLAMCLLAFPTDPTNSAAPATLHGRLHDGAFATVGVALLASMAAFGFVFRRRGQWGTAIFSWGTAALIVPSFTVKGIVFYFFLAAFLAWSEVAALRLLRGGVGGWG